MLPVGTAADARRMDSAAIAGGVPSLLLMENAAFSLFLAVHQMLSSFDPDHLVVFAGKGGNGGDGMALLRLLADRGCTVPLTLVPLFDPSTLSGDPLLNYRMLPRSIRVMKQYRALSGKILFVDAMLGTGGSDMLSPRYRAAVEFINRYSRKRVLAVDLPTGLSSDTGMARPVAVRADTTVSLGLLKSGLFLDEGPLHAGNVLLGPISAPPPKDLSLFQIEEKDFVPCDPALTAHKGKNGRLLVIGGEAAKIGASFIVAEAFLAAGGGLATVAVPDGQLLKLAGRYPGIMLLPYAEALSEPDLWDVVVCGPGLRHLPKQLLDLLVRTKARLILDAGIFDHADAAFLRRLHHKEILYTPHPGELSRVMTRLGISGAWHEQVQRFPLGPRQCLYAKQASSRIRYKKLCLIVPFGARALSFGGTGDALAGILASFATTTGDLRQAAVNAALLHRRAGILLETKFSPRFHRISTLIEQVGFALAHFSEENAW